ncbi:hypothetical protein CKA32_000980 [Geitlerinema sp. FC II]|nr:hypothetical protein CKA32_000980 [Geitlerinema sp. FC II]
MRLRLKEYTEFTYKKPYLVLCSALASRWQSVVEPKLPSRPTLTCFWVQWALTPTDSRFLPNENDTTTLFIPP